MDNFIFLQTLETESTTTTTGMTQSDGDIFLKLIEGDDVLSVCICESDAADILNSIKLTLQMIEKASKLGECVC